MNSNGVEFENYERRDERIPDIDAIEEARYEMMMGGVNEFKKEEQDDSWLEIVAQNNLW